MHDEFTPRSAPASTLPPAVPALGCAAAALLADVATFSLGLPGLAVSAAFAGGSFLLAHFALSRANAVAAASAAPDPAAQSRIAALESELLEARAEAAEHAERSQHTRERAREGGREIEEALEETASFFAHINSSIRGINDEVERLAGSVSGASTSIEQMNESIERVSFGASRLHDASNATASTVHEMTASIRQVADSADSVQGMAEESAAAMIEMDRAIHEVSSHVEDAARLT
ncbi:MAG: methyl-accepting chemotaxis protein, partial [Deltaproteobacteria bacterium]|nr:methyl-accepting chemotaxis protein [Deltaproteobacteria bacterium]